MKNHHLLSLGLFILWLFVTIGLFYTVQKPFTSATILAVGNTVLNLWVAGWVGGLGLGLGHRLLGWLQTNNFWADLSTAEILVLGTGLGLGALGLLTFGLGLAGLFYTWLFWGLSLALTMALWQDFVALFYRFGRWQPMHPPRLAIFYLSILSLLTLLTALLPPTDWDGLFYHLTAPKIFIAQHRLISGLDVPHFNFPLLGEMLFSYTMLLRNDITAKLIHFLYGGLLTGLVYLLARRLLKREAGWPAVLIFLSMPMITTLASWAYNDLALAFYQLAALYALLRGQESENGQRDWLVLSGIFAGLAMCLKYTSFVGPLTLVLFLIVDFKNPKKLLYFAMPAILVAAPWYIKNYFFTGNPFYPFVFEGLFWDKFRAAWYAQAGTGIGWNFGKLVSLPLLATLGIHDANYFDGRTGPLFLAFLPLIGFWLFEVYRQSEIVNPKSVTAVCLGAIPFLDARRYLVTRLVASPFIITLFSNLKPTYGLAMA